MGKSLPFSAWPLADQSLWQSLRQKGGPLDDLGALADLRETTARIYKATYGRWLEWLQQNEAAALAEEPAARATLTRLQTWLAAGPTLRPTSRAMYFNGVLRVLQAAFPETDWSRHKRVGLRLTAVAGHGDPTRKQGKILCSRVLLQAGLRHAKLDAQAATTPLGRAKAQRDGAMVALLAMMPLRHRAFTGLRIGQSVLITDRAVTVVLPEELTKTGVAWEAEVPEPAATALRVYVSEARPFLLPRAAMAHDVLWVGNMGEPMSYSYIGKRIPDITGRLTGTRIPPHFFRDAAATTLARESRTAALVIGPVLGHSGSNTAERHYIQAGSVEAGRELANLVKRLKERN